MSISAAASPQCTDSIWKNDDLHYLADDFAASPEIVQDCGGASSLISIFCACYITLSIKPSHTITRRYSILL